MDLQSNAKEAQDSPSDKAVKASPQAWEIRAVFQAQMTLRRMKVGTFCFAAMHRHIGKQSKYIQMKLLKNPSLMAHCLQKTSRLILHVNCLMDYAMHYQNRKICLK